jgi:hypothetical protein
MHGSVRAEHMEPNFHSCTVHLDTVKSHLLSNGCTIIYSKKNVKMYIKININLYRTKVTFAVTQVKV